MIPRILEYENGRIKITENAYVIPELKDILDKHEPNSEPYLAHAYLLSFPDSPYLNLPNEEQEVQAQMDISITYGNYDSSDELLQPAINRLRSLFKTAVTELVDELEEELYRQIRFLRDNPISNENLKLRNDIFKNGATIIQSYKKMKKEVDEELKEKLRGNVETGMYDERKKIK